MKIASIYSLGRCFAFALAIVCGVSHAQGDARQFSIHSDAVSYSDKSLYQSVFVTVPAEDAATISLIAYQKNAEDSSLLYKVSFKDIALKSGAQQVVLSFKHAEPVGYYVLPRFRNVLAKTKSLPPGDYALLATITSTTGSETKYFTYHIASALDAASPLKRTLSHLVLPKALQQKAASGPSKATDKAGILLGNAESRIRKYARKNGYTFTRGEDGIYSWYDLYAEGWFIGRYQVSKQSSAIAQLQSEQQQLEADAGSFTDNQLDNYQSLLSQFRKMKEDSKDEAELNGEVAVAGNFSNGQEENAGWDNNFYELRGDLSFPVMDIPVTVSGYYTSQDKNREAKSSYIRFSYDAAKAKEQLLKLISSYNRRYEQTLTQGANLDMIYGSYVSKLQQEKEIAIAQLKKSSGIEGYTDGLSKEMLEAELSDNLNQARQKVTDSLQGKKDGLLDDSTATAAKQQALAAEQKAKDAYQSAMDKYQRILELEQQISKYQALLNQYRNTLHYDSLLAYDQLKDLKSGDQATYKDLAKKASSLLPEGKAKSLISGLTSFDAGMFPKYVSDYTQSGQMIKGLDIGYDIGIAEVGATYGKTEYIDRSGSVESYKAYGTRATTKPIGGQQFGLSYYGYSPSRSLLEDNQFFKGSEVSLPGFRSPTHIIAATYKGELSQYAIISGEYAFSNKQEQTKEGAAQTPQNDKSAYNIKVSGNIPGTQVNIDAGYEHAGSAFENNTLPVIMAGTDRIRTAAKGDFLRSFLTLGIEYNYLVQNSLYSKGSNSRWGFDIATHSKRYPSVYLSYKPFSTFRAYDDTLNIEQKPMLGSVWTGRTNYQIKRMDKAIRFTLLYTCNSSTMDTLSYGSTLVQFSTILSDRSKMLTINTGYNDVRSDAPTAISAAYAKSYFIGANIGLPITESLLFTGGTDLACNRQGLSRYSFTVGNMLLLKKIPFTIRTNFRFNNYKLDEITGWKQLYSGSIELAYRINMKLKE